MSDDVEMRKRKVEDEDSMDHSDLIRDILYNFSEQFNTKLLNKIEGHEDLVVQILVDEKTNVENSLEDFIYDWASKGYCSPQEVIKNLCYLMDKLLLRCVETENLFKLRKFLLLFEDIIENQYLEDFSVIADFRKNSEPHLRACEKNKYEMIFAFIQCGFKLEIDKGTIERLRGTSKWSLPLLRRAFKKVGVTVDVLAQLRIYQCLSKPVYMIAKYKQKIDCETVHEDPGLEEYYGDLKDEDMKKIDPITKSFLNVRNSRDCIKNHTEYTEKFDKIIEENNKFAVDMLDLCRSQEEAELVLSNTIIPDDFQFKGETNPFQLLKIGLMNSNYDFIAHDYTQQALRERMAQSDDGQVILLWNSTHVVGKVFYVVITCFLMPFYLFMRIFWDMSSPFIYQPQGRSVETSVASSFTRSTSFQRPTQKSAFTLFLTYFTFPINRCLASLFFNLIYCGLLIAASLVEESEEDQDGMGMRITGSMYLRLIIMLISFAYLVRLFEFRGNIVRNVKLFTTLVVANTCLFLGAGIKFVNVVLLKRTGLEDDYTDNDAQTEMCLTAIGMMLFFVTNLYWFQLNRSMGPIATNMNKVFSDILMVFYAYVVFFLASAAGFHLILNKIVFGEEEDCGDTEEYNAFANFLIRDNTNETAYKDRDGAFKALFWVLFDPGQPEKVGCKRSIAGTLGLALWALYQIINVVVLLNICVALMNTTMMKLESNKENVWKFCRTDAWLIFIDDVNLPVPFNLWSSLINWLHRIGGHKKKQMDLTGKKSNYMKLVAKLVDRYLILIEDSTANTANGETLDHFRKEMEDAIKLIQEKQDF